MNIEEIKNKLEKGESFTMEEKAKLFELLCLTQDTIKGLKETIEDIMPQMGNIVISDYGRLNNSLSDAGRLLKCSNSAITTPCENCGEQVNVEHCNDKGVCTYCQS